MLRLTPIPAFNDNYIWCIVCDDSKQALLVDPGDYKASYNYLKQESLTLFAILITHHHNDHVGGVSQLKRDFPLARVVGFENANHPHVETALCEGQSIDLLGTRFDVYEVPGHTLDHIAFFSAADSFHHETWLFCGDTLFSVGCGRIFEGTAKQMFDSIAKLSCLPPETLVCCAHEYTLANIRFAETVMHNSKELKSYKSNCLELRENGEATLPTPLRTELQVNPFLRTDDPTIVSALKSADLLGSAPSEVDVFAALRKAKDVF